MEELTKKLIKEIQYVSKIIEEYQEYENEFKKYKYTVNINDNPTNKLKKQESYFEKLYESIEYAFYCTDNTKQFPT